MPVPRDLRRGRGCIRQRTTRRGLVSLDERADSYRQRIGTVKRSIDSDAALMESARRTNDAPGNLLSLETRNEFIDPVYETIDAQIATSRTMLAALERKKTQVVDVRKLDGSQVAQLTRLYELESEQSRLELERDLTTAVYRQVATAYETVRVQVASRSAQLQILDRAVPADRPLSRHVTRNALMGLLGGLLAGSIGAVIHSAATSRR